MGEGVTAYREVTFAPEIAKELTEAGFLGAPDSNGPQGLCLNERVLEAAGFHSFASFRTNRAKFRCVACVSSETTRLLLAKTGIARPCLNLLVVTVEKLDVV